MTKNISTSLSLKGAAFLAATVGLLVPGVIFAHTGYPSNSPALTAVYDASAQTLTVSGSFTGAPDSSKERGGFASFIAGSNPTTTGSSPANGVLDTYTNLLPYLASSGTFTKTYTGVATAPANVCVAIYDLNVDDSGTPTNNNGGDHSTVVSGPSHNIDNSWDKDNKDTSPKKSAHTFATGDCAVPTIINAPNTAPVIVLNGANPLNITLGSVYSEPGAVSNDAEDGNGIALLASEITGIVNNLLIGSYTIHYNHLDTGGLAAAQVDRTVNVVAGTTQCSDGIDNDEDGTADYPADAGCSSYSDDSENEKPVITVLGTNPVEIVVNVGTYSEEGATADDAEDGNNIPLGGSNIDASAVNTGVVGSYLVRYNFTDSDGASADEKTRTVNVVSGVNECNDGIDNDGDGTADYSGVPGGEETAALEADAGCDSVDDTTENQAPEVIVDTPVITITLSGAFVPPTGVHATDPEDGDITVDVVNNPVDTNVVDDYTVTYGATDSDGASAANQTQTIHVRAQCADGVSNDEDGLVDSADPGCHTDGNVNNEESYDPSHNDETDPVDLCSNIEGYQVTVPEGMVEDGGICTTPEQPVDVCSNIEGDQATVPEGMVANDGVCTTPVQPVDVCSNISGDQATVPSGYTENGGICTETPIRSSGGGGGGCAPGFVFDPSTFKCVPAGSVLGASTGAVLGESCGLYMDQHLKKGSAKNNPAQVTKLQNFLTKKGFANFTPTGVFGPLTEAAVKAFQTKYSADVLTPWGLTEPTGLAYLTTLRQINMIECPDLMLPVPALVDWDKNPNAQ